MRTLFEYTKLLDRTRFYHNQHFDEVLQTNLFWYS